MLPGTVTIFSRPDCKACGYAFEIFEAKKNLTVIKVDLNARPEKVDVLKRIMETKAKVQLPQIFLNEYRIPGGAGELLLLDDNNELDALLQEKLSTEMDPSFFN